MDLSDLSGCPIESDAPAWVIVRLGDGRRRKLVVTAQEAATLAEKGSDVSRARNRVSHWLRKHVLKLFLWAAGVFVASLAIPAATKQWADRQAAIALKAGLIGEVSRSSAEGFIGAKRLLVAAKLPDVRSELRSARDGWEASEGGIDAQYAVYFRDTAARKSWNTYRDRIYDYISLGCCDEHRVGDIRLLRGYLGAPRPWPTTDDPWQVLGCGRGESCGTVSPDFAEAYRWLGIQLLRKRESLLADLRRAQPAGFSGGWGDFLRDTFAPIHP
jgi:hypothetical protein